MKSFRNCSSTVDPSLSLEHSALKYGLGQEVVPGPRLLVPKRFWKRQGLVQPALTEKAKAPACKCKKDPEAAFVPIGCKAVERCIGQNPQNMSEMEKGWYGGFRA
jgi:hypothetical protein